MLSYYYYFYCYYFQIFAFVILLNQLQYNVKILALIQPIQQGRQQQQQQQQQSRRDSLEHIIRSTIATTIVGTSIPSIASAAVGGTSGGILSFGSRTQSKSLSSEERIYQRLQDNIIIKQQPLAVRQQTGLIYPNYLEGTWDVLQTLTNIQTPIGLQYIGGPNGSIQIAQQSINEAMKQINKPVSLQFKFVTVCNTNNNIKNGVDDNNKNCYVVEDRLYNTQQRLDQFAGRKVVSTISYADVGTSNRATTIKYGGTEYSPLTTTFVRFYKNPAIQKTFVTSYNSGYLLPNVQVRNAADSQNNESTTTTTTTTTKDDTGNNNNNKSWVGYESYRSLFALTNENTAPPITTDSEIIIQLNPQRTEAASFADNNKNVNVINGTIRIVGYLNPNDKYYFDTQNRAVSIQDYTIQMTRKTIS